MANKTRKYTVSFTWKEDGNRVDPYVAATSATTVQRAISKVVKEVNEGLVKGIDGKPLEVNWPESFGDDDEARAADFMFVDVRSADFHN